MPPMRILFTRFPYESSFGGAEIQTLAVMEGLRQKGHSVSFAGSCAVLVAECRKRGFAVTELEIGKPPVSKWTALSFLWRQGSMKKKLLRLLDEPVDAIFMLSLSEKLLLTDVAAGKGARVFWMEHDRIGPWFTSNPWLSRLRRLSAQAMTVCVSELSRRIFFEHRWDQDKMIAIPNGIDLKKFAGTPVSYEHKNLLVGCVARLSKEKGVHILIKAAAAVPSMDLTIVGSGREKVVLEGYISALHLSERVRIVPALEDLAAFYKSLDVFVLPSCENDPFGLVAAEAMASGVATIVTDACGIADKLMNGKDALIAQADNVESLAVNLQKLTDPAARSRIAQEGLTTVTREFGMEKMVDAYETLLR